VVDASVSVKWFIRDPIIEPDVDKAWAVLRGMRSGTIEACQPPHWFAEVLATIARARPRRVALTLGMLSSLTFRETAPLGTYRRAVDMAISLNHHLFDTLYHAVALEEGVTLVTADEVYFGKAQSLGGIQRLADFSG
jgi:predicted nucleic acid-binding protein